MSKARLRLILIIVMIAACGGVQAQGPTIDALANQADTIVVGEVQSGRQNARLLAFLLTVVRSIKGSSSPGAVLNVSGSCGPSAVNKDLTGSYGMFFLNKAGNGQWTLRPVMKGTGFETTYFPLSKASSPANINTTSQVTTQGDQIAVELVAALQSYTNPLQLYHLENGLIGISDSAVVQDLFRSLKARSDPELRFLALAKLLRTGDADALAQVAADVDLLPNLVARTFVIPAIHAQAYSGQGAVGPLGKIAASSDIYVQRAAADALMSIHTKNTLPFLAGLLDSTDSTNRELAMRGLSRFVENLPSMTQNNVRNGKSLSAQGPAVYRTAQTDRYSLSTRRLQDAAESETAFLQFWKTWWASMKDEVTR
jgi:hypothetical protein